MPSGDPRQQGLAAEPHGGQRSERGRRRHADAIGGDGTRSDWQQAACQNLWREQCGERDTPQSRPTRLPIPHLAWGARTERLHEGRIDEACAEAQAAHNLGCRRILCDLAGSRWM